MKELSIEEKAKAYDEVIQKLRGMMPNWERLSYNGKTFLQDLIYIIPELKENEDEKIRKGLVRLLKELLELGGVAEDEWDRNECEKYIAWLEKQDEKPIKSGEWDINEFRTWQYIVSDVLTKWNGIGQYLDGEEYRTIAKKMQEEWSKKLA